MIEEIRISGLGVIEEATLELGSGLTVITGETGAGKTMVLQGLALLLGGRADSGVVRTGSARASVDGTVVLSTPSARPIVEELDASVEDDRLILSRSVGADGRSKAVIGGRSTPVSALAELADSLVVVHGQSDQIRLTKPGQQRELLDRYGVEPALSASYATAYERWRELAKHVATLEADLGQRARRLEELREDLSRIDAVNPQTGELEQIEHDLGRLANAESLHDAASTAYLALTGDPDDPAAGGDATSSLAVAVRALSAQADRDPAFGAIAAELEKAASIVADAASELSRHVDALDADPARLDGLQQRKAALTALVRRHGQSLDDVLEFAKSARVEVEELDDDEALPRLRAEVGAAAADCSALAKKLHQARTHAAHKLEQRAGAELAGLGMPSASLHVAVTPREELAAHGGDDVEILLAAHEGATPRALGKGASGGELSRVMLALEVALAGADPVPTMVFDEVDAGVGGKAAIEVGARLAQLAREHQVICVTHLAQVAAFADHHVVVRKSHEGGVTATDVTVVTDDEERLVELSRMLSGVEHSEAAHTHARELRELALSRRSQ